VPPRDRLPFVSVIIPVLDDQDRLDACLAALEEQTYPRDAFEVVVVDNGSTPPMRVDGTRARLLVEPRPGSYAARNTGIAAARGEVIAFTDADCLPLPSWLEAGVRRLGAEPGVGLVAGAIEVFCQDRERPTAAELFEVHCRGFAQQSYVEQQGFGATANLFATRVATDAVGGFDAALMSAGDVDFCRRATAVGHALVYEPKARVRHPARHSMKNLLMKVSRVEFGGMRLARLRGQQTRPRHRFPLPLRLLAVPVRVNRGISDLGLRHRIATTMAALAVEVARAATRLAFDRGLTLDLRRFWGK